MSSIVERLRQHALPDPHDEREVMHAPLLKEAADLIEQQAERIKELESALQAADEGRNYANQLLTERSQRVRELQEKIQEMAKEHVEFVLISHSAVCGERDSLKEELAALQKRIDDAPVVAWMGEYNINDIRDHYTVVMRHKTDFSSMPDRVRPLYATPQPAIPDGWLKEMPDILREAAAILAKEKYMRFPIIDELRGFAAMLAAAPKPEGQ